MKNTTFNIEDQVRLAGQKATAALGALKPGFTAQDLVSALNVDIINFPTGSAQIPADQYDFLNKAASAIKAAPSDTVLAIGGYTDNTGDAASNLTLSQRRAEAVRNYLIQQVRIPNVLTAKGYGEAHPLSLQRYRGRQVQQPPDRIYSALARPSYLMVRTGPMSPSSRG